MLNIILTFAFFVIKCNGIFVFITLTTPSDSKDYKYNFIDFSSDLETPTWYYCFIDYLEKICWIITSYGKYIIPLSLQFKFNFSIHLNEKIEQKYVFNNFTTFHLFINCW